MLEIVRREGDMVLFRAGRVEVWKKVQKGSPADRAVRRALRRKFQVIEGKKVT